MRSEEIARQIILDWQIEREPKQGLHRPVKGERLLVQKITAALDERVEQIAAYWDETEARSAEAHAVYQQEAHRRGDVRHADAYADLPDATKEWDRVLVRWVAASCRALKGSK